jgi:UDP-N-acetylmuramoyl-L-alanyl-D-glutamate--2,6-diaminopimelate ligase
MMTLKMAVEGIRVVEARGDLETQVAGINSDTRKTAPGDLFVAVRGDRANGHDFINSAIEKGASAVVLEGRALNGSVPSVAVTDTREALARISSNYHGRPSERLLVTGVTGTNGKTTVTYLLKSIVEAAGKKAGLVGTIRYMIGDKSFPAPFTTPEAIEFQGLLRKMLEAGVGHVVCEVSSHALALKRVDATRFETAVFTNLTRDHLDFHREMEDYFRAKERLFKELLSPEGTAVINIDDPYGKRLEAASRGKVLTYAVEGDADLRAEGISVTANGLSFTVRHGGGHYRLDSPLTGPFNVYNILAASGAALSLGLGWSFIAEGVKNMGQVRGRFEKVDLGQEFLCVIDYAHTEDALRRLILAARPMTEGRVITVFGCGGDRDRGKRPAMGSVATELSDLVFITSDNPRSEDPMEIIGEIRAGVRRNNYRIVADRREAIEEAVMAAAASDAVLIAGKGHEDYQEVKGVRSHFSDREAAEDAIRKRTN